jgi:hypothetical protein
MSMTLEACEYLVGMDEWTLVQAPLLFVEIDPSKIPQQLIKKLGNYSAQFTKKPYLAHLERKTH